jgi:hypothetical protein
MKEESLCLHTCPQYHDIHVYHILLVLSHMFGYVEQKHTGPIAKVVFFLNLIFFQ